MSSASDRFEVHSDPRGSDGERFWPLDLTLLLTGTILIWLVIRFLKFDDPRILFNPITYLIAVPTILIGISMLVRLVANKFVEQSLQLAFLVSVLIHLLLLLAAVNVVIFARFWPDVFESISVQPQMQRKTLPDYLVTRRTGSSSATKPDYMRPVETVLDPTESPDATASAASVTGDTRQNLQGVQPDAEQRLEAFLQARQTPSMTAPALADSTAKLSRSERKPEPNSASPIDVPQLEPPLTADPEPVQPTDLPLERSAAAAQMAAAAPLADAQLLDNAAMPALPPASSVARSAASANAPSLPERMPAINLPKSNRARADQPESAAARSSIRVPKMADQRESAESTASLAPSATAVERRSLSSSLTVPDPLAKQDQPGAPATDVSVQSADPQLNMKRRRDEPQIAINSQSIGSDRSLPRQTTAGGAVAAAPAAALPLTGPIALPKTAEIASPDPSAAQSIVADTTLVPRSRPTTSDSTLSGSPLMADPSEGLASLVPVPRPSPTGRNTDTGTAISLDSAGMAGIAGAPLVRSDLGRSASGGSIPIPGSKVGVPSVGENGAGDSASGSTGQIDDSGKLAEGAKPVAAAAGAELGKRGAASSLASGDPIDGLSAEGDLESESTLKSSGMAASAAPFRPEPGLESLAGTTGRESAFDPGQRTTLGAGPPTNATVGVPRVPVTDADGTTGADRLAPAEQIAGSSESRERSSASQIAGARQMPLDALDGAGGLVPNAADLGELIARSSTRSQPSLFEFQTQRFLRSEIGGRPSLSAGVPVPKPAFQQRLERNKSQPDLRGTAGPETEEAIELGLAFLARNQRSDGSWVLEEFSGKDVPVKIRSQTAATALSLLAFQGAGYTHQEFKYATVADKALGFLLQNQQASGDLYIPQDAASDQNAWLYSHSIASLALCEAYGMTQDPRLREPAQRAVKFMVDSQDPERGGWRYRPGLGTDTSVTGWFLMALKSAELAGLDVPKSTFDRIQNWLSESQASPEEPYLYRYNPRAPDTDLQRHGKIANPTMTSVGLLMRLYFGWKRDNPNMIRGADYLLQSLPEIGTVDSPARDTYYWYYATQVLFHMGGEHWEKWNGVLRPMLIESQERTGPMAGSWDPTNPVPDIWARFGGRTYLTTLNLLSLEVYYRHLPLYEATAK